MYSEIGRRFLILLFIGDEDADKLMVKMLINSVVKMLINLVKMLINQK